jgi:two-component system nitrate/nitrite response regulator NarL
MRSVCLVVGHGVHREALTATLVEAGFTVGAVLAGGGGTLAPIREMAADVLLIDVPSLEGLPLLRALRREGRLGRTVVMARAGEEVELPRWLHEGAMGVVLATESRRDLLAAVEAVAAGATRYPAAVLAACLAPGGTLGLMARNGSPWGHLTEREQEIVSLIDRGCSNKEIAYTLGIRLSTVKNHVHHILEKLNARGRAAAAAQVAGRR